MRESKGNNYIGSCWYCCISLDFGVRQGRRTKQGDWRCNGSGNGLHVRSLVLEGIPKMKELRQKYVLVKKSGRKWKCQLRVGIQSFTVCENKMKSEAEWFGDMLATALEKLVKAETKNEITRPNQT